MAIEFNPATMHPASIIPVTPESNNTWLIIIIIIIIIILILKNIKPVTEQV